jgi:hypothetical protein
MELFDLVVFSWKFIMDSIKCVVIKLRGDRRIN